MSLINQALKLEQQKRNTPQGPIAPMVMRAAHRGHNDKLTLILFGFTGIGMLLAASVTAIFYFGSDFLGSEKTLAYTVPAHSENTLLDSPEQTASLTVPKIEDLLDNLSQEQLSTVQEMLLRRESDSEAANHSHVTTTAPLTPEIRTQPNLAEVSRIQGIIDTFSVQGIRKSGQDTRVFLNGKIRKIGDIIDIENSIQLIGFTETSLVFRNPSGARFEKPL